MNREPTTEPAPWIKLAKVGGVIALIVLFGFAVVAGGSYLGRQVGAAIGDDESSQPANFEPGLEATVEIPAGSTAKEIGAILAANGVVKSALEFEVAVRNADVAADLKAGTYALTTGMDPAEVVAVLVIGEVADVYRLTVIEGLRTEEILVSIAETSGISFEELETALISGDVTTSLVDMPSEPTLTDWEGLLFPDTYEFTRSTDAVSILQRLASTMEQRVDSIDWTVMEDLGLSPYEGLILASLVESEVLLDIERPVVSSVIHNRLNMGMKLDIDATVLYAVDSRDIADFDREVASPYNTYLNAGLPPTPIAAPGRSSLEAAANPDTTEFLFYVLSDLDGHHAFAVTLDEHNANVAKAKAEGVLG